MPGLPVATSTAARAVPATVRSTVLGIVSITPAEKLVDLLAPLRATRAVGQVPAEREGEFGLAEPEGTLTVKIAELPMLRSLGVRFEELTEKDGPDRERRALVIDQIMPGSPAARAGLHPGLHVVSVGNRAVASREEAESIASRLNGDQGIALQVLMPDGNLKEVTIGGPRRRP